MRTFACIFTLACLLAGNGLAHRAAAEESDLIKESLEAAKEFLNGPEESEPREEPTDEAKAGEEKPHHPYAQPPPMPKPPKVAVFQLEGLMPEFPSDPILAMLSGSPMETLSLFDLARRLEAARQDPDLKAVVFDLDYAMLDMAQVQELREYIKRLKAAEKDIWFFTEDISTQTLLVGGGADHFALTPEGGSFFTGLYSESYYYKDLLDRLKVEAEVIHIGDYKSAGEPYYRNGPSAESQQQTNELLDGVFAQIISAVAEDRELDRFELAQLVDRGPLTAREALEEGLVDKLEYRGEFSRRLKEAYGENLEIDRDYGAAAKEEPSIDSLFSMFGMFRPKDAKKPVRMDESIAVVVLEGVISGPAIRPVRRAMLEAAEDDAIKGLVLRVSSPGGSALASDILWQATQQFRDSGKPLVVSMGGVAASGGYYVSAGADHIFANPGTITGSIGVVGMKLSYRELTDWLGVHTHSQQRGRKAHLLSSSEPFSEEDQQLMRKLYVSTYNTFLSRVGEGRKDKLAKKVEKLAGGRVYTGERALEIGLVDELGNLNDAISHAAELAKMGEDYKVKLMPEPISLIEMLTAPPEEEDNNFIFATTGARQPGPGDLLKRFEPLQAQLAALRELDPTKARALEEFLETLVLARKEGALLIGPAIRIR